MELLQWKVNSLQTQYPDLQDLIQFHDLPIICLQETHLCLSQTLNMCGFTAYQYDHFDGDRPNRGIAVSVKDCLYCAQLTSTHHFRLLPSMYIYQLFPSLCVMYASLQQYQYLQALDKAPQYSRQKCMPSRHVQ
jgi:exonuclease III